MTRALVTGSTGCVGANLVAALNAHGIDVVGLRRTTSPDSAVQGLRMEVRTGDILDPASLRTALEGIDWVFHVAAVADYWQVDKATLYRVNVEGARNVMQAALEAGVERFVLTGSTAALGLPTASQPLLNETSTFNLRAADFPYGHSKHLAEQAMAELVERGLPAICVLPSAVMGPRDLKFNAGELIKRAVRGELLLFPRGGLNYVDALDCAYGHIAAAERGQVGRRYILAGENITHHQSLETINTVLGTTARTLTVPNVVLPVMALGVDILKRAGIKLPIDRSRVLMSQHHIYYDNTRARQELGMRFRPFAESVKAAYDWYIAHGYLEQELPGTQRL